MKNYSYIFKSLICRYGKLWVTKLIHPGSKSYHHILLKIFFILKREYIFQTQSFSVHLVHLPCLDKGSKMAVSISSNVMTLRSVNTSIILNGMATDWYKLLCSTLHIEWHCDHMIHQPHPLNLQQSISSFLSWTSDILLSEFWITWCFICNHFWHSGIYVYVYITMVTKYNNTVMVTAHTNLSTSICMLHMNIRCLVMVCSVLMSLVLASRENCAS